MIDATQIGQAIIGGLIVAGYVINQIQARSAAKTVKIEATIQADKVATKVDIASETTTGKIEEIHSLVNSQSQVQLEKIAGLEAALKEARKE